MMRRRLEGACFLVLAAVVGLRPLILERYDSAVHDLTRALEVVSDPSPVWPLVLDFVILLVAALWWSFGSSHRRRGYVRSGLEWGLPFLVIGVVVSSAFAGNKRLAANGAADWLCCLLLAVMLVQMLNRAWRVRLLVSVILASGAAQAVECIHQVALVFPETEAMYRENREELWSRQGVALDSAHVEMFEARMASREAFGYLAHSNVTGAHLAMCVALAVGVVVSVTGSRPRTVGRYVGPVALTVLLVAALVATRSRGAMLACAIVVVLAGGRFVYAQLIDRNKARIFRCAWMVAAVVLLAVVGHGLYHGSLPGRSLDFRWNYWTASAHMFGEHALTGVGSGNFGRHYLSHKTIDSPEEVQTPHNFLVSAAVDWGVPGLLAMGLFLWFGSRRIFVECEDFANDGEGDTARGTVVRAGAIVAFMIFVARLPLLGSSDPNLLYFGTMLPLIAWAVGFLGVTFADIRQLRPVASLGAFALLAFLLQDTINFASIVPGTLVTAAACFAVAISPFSPAGEVSESKPQPLRHMTQFRLARILADVAWLGSLTLSVVGLAPVWRADRAIASARATSDPRAAIDAYLHAATADPLDPTPLIEAAERLLANSATGVIGASTLDQAIDLLRRAEVRDPYAVEIPRLLTRCYLHRASRTNQPVDRDAAVASARRVLEIYPIESQSHVLLGDALTARGVATDNRDDLSQAVAHFARAIEIDQARPAWETIRRLRPVQIDAIRRRIENAGRKLSETR